MEGVDHVDVVEVGGGRLIGQVHRVLEGQVPDGEGLELGVARLHPPLILVVELAEAHRHLAAAGAGGGDHHQGAGSLHVLVLPVALVADDERDVSRIARNGVVEVDPDAQPLQSAAEGVGGGLTVVLGDHHAPHVQPLGPEGVDQTQHIHVVGDPQIPPHLVLLDVAGADGDDDLRPVLELGQHPDLAVRFEAGQHPGGVKVVEQLAAELQVQLVSELGDPLRDTGRLHLQIPAVVKSGPVHSSAGAPILGLRPSHPLCFCYRYMQNWFLAIQLK